MKAPVATSGFLELLEESGLLTSSQIERAVRTYDLLSCESPRDVAKQLVRHRVLTPFQGDRLLEGRYRGFFIDRYKVREILGVGGMGNIYVAEDTRSGEKVAVKLLNQRHETDAGMLERLRLEARAGMLLDHPNIAKTYRLESCGAVTFIVMEMVRGVSLHEMIALQGAVPCGMACDMMHQAALGLHSAHKKGIFHRDVKPANLLIGNDGHLTILDFGLALISDQVDEEFSLAMIFGHDCLGTPDFIAPEQSLDSRSIDAAADVYSLGCTFYLALSGRLPFPMSDDAEKLAAHRQQTPVALRDLTADLPGGVVAVIETMMEKKREQRYQSMAQVAEAVAPYCERKKVTFDFREIITLRAREAAKRERRRRSGADSSSIDGPSAFKLHSGHSLQAKIETLVNDDTRPLGDPDAVELRVLDSDAFATLGEPRTSQLRATPWRLVVQGRNARIPLGQDRLVIGRSPDCDLKIAHSSISARHAELQLDRQRWTLSDLESKNGVLVNGRSVERRVLAEGDVIQFGNGPEFRLIHELRPDGPPEPAVHPLWFPALVIVIAVVTFFVTYWFFAP